MRRSLDGRVAGDDLSRFKRPKMLSLPCFLEEIGARLRREKCSLSGVGKKERDMIFFAM